MRVPGDPLDDQLGEDVVRVRVRVAVTGRKQRLVGDANPDELARRPVVAEVSAQIGLQVARVVLEVVEEAARVVEQLADRDLAPVRNEAGQPLLDAVVQAELAFGDQLEHDRCGVALGQACDLEVVVRPASASCGRRRPVPRRAAQCDFRYERAGWRRVRPRRRARRRPSAARLSRCLWPSSVRPSPMRRSQRPPPSTTALLPRPHASASCQALSSVFDVVSCVILPPSLWARTATGQRWRAVKCARLPSRPARGVADLVMPVLGPAMWLLSKRLPEHRRC